MNHVLKSMDRFCFPEAPASRLAILRILAGLYSLYYLVPRFSKLIGISETNPMLFSPVGLATPLGAPLSVDLFQLILIATLALNVLFVLGWKHRWVAPVFALMLLFVFSYRNSWSMIYHSANALVVHVLILSITPSAHALSLDSWLGNTGVSDEHRKSHWSYGWPILLISTATLLTYFMAGIAKVVGPMGWAWAGGEALRGQVAVDALRKDLFGDGAMPLAFMLYNQVWLYTLLGVGTLVLELGAPLVVFNKRLARFWAFNAFLMHWGIYFIMGIKFRYCLSGIIFASFFDVERVLDIGKTIRSKLPFLRPPAVAAEANA